MKLRERREEAGLTQAALAQELGLSQSQISRYEDDPDSIPFGLLRRWLARLGVDPGREVIQTEHPSAPIDVGDPWEALRGALDRLDEACRRALEEGPEELCDGDGALPTPQALQALARRSRRKPNLVLAGRSDAGKSRLANSFLGQALLPTRYGPMTRLVTHVRHVSERPDWVEDAAVVIVDGDLPIEELIDSERRSKAVRLKGGTDLLHSRGAYEVGAAASEDATEAVYVFSDAPILRAVNLIDLPGSRGDVGHADVDAAHAEKAFALADVLVYASPVSGFVSGPDLEFLSHWIRMLPPWEQNDPSFPPLGHLFVVATHAAHHVPMHELREHVFAGGRERLWRHVGETAIVERATLTKRAISRQDVDARFFAFWAERADIRDELHAAVGDVIGRCLPGAWVRQTEAVLGGFRKKALASAKKRLNELNEMTLDLDRAEKEHEAFLLSERIAAPMRRRRQRLIEEHFQRISERVRKSLADSWSRRTSAEAIEALIRRRYSQGDAKEQARRAAASAVLELVRADVFEASQRLTSNLPEEIGAFLAEYDETHVAESGVPMPADLAIPTDGRGMLAGLTGAGAALAMGLSGGLILLAAGLLWSFFGTSWQRRLAKRLADEFARRDLRARLDEELRRQWAERLARFQKEAARLENEHQRQIESRGELFAKARRDRSVLEEHRERAEFLAAFFLTAPTPRLSKDGSIRQTRSTERAGKA